MKSKTLITVPALNKPGGVAALYNVLKLEKNRFEHFEVQGKWHEASPPQRFLEIIVTYFQFIKKLQNVEVVILNPSFNKKSFLRDSVFFLLSKLLQKRVIVFWHGWSPQFYKLVEGSSLYQSLFKATYIHADRTIFLASRFKDDLENLGLKGITCLESNTADVDYLESTLTSELQTNFTNKPYILFMARIVREKGVFIAIDAFYEISQMHDVDLVIAGSGPDFEAARAYVNQSIIKRVHFLGHISAEVKHAALSKASICLFPTYYGEGMPLSAIEALAYGKPLITRAEGGISDWLIHSVDAIIEESKAPKQFAIWLSKLLSDDDYANRMGKKARVLFEKSFHPDVMRKRLSTYVEELNA